MANSTNQLVEHFFRHESANVVAVLTRAFGIARLELVEDMVQVAMLDALNAWKHREIPENPAGWIHRVATQRILDRLRREKVHQNALSQVEQPKPIRVLHTEDWLDEEIRDSLLRMVFVCCHPSLDLKTQIALALKTLCGFGVVEISRGLLMPAETVKKRIQRAKSTLARANVGIELPHGTELHSRLCVVHDVLYLMFNEGYSTSHGMQAIRDDICEEATRLCHLLCESECSTPETKALLALMLFQAARLSSRCDESGAVVLLEDQDREEWDQELICHAQFWLSRSRAESPTRYHLEAAIAMKHCVASSVAETDWATIVQLYSQLLQRRHSPIYVLNRAIALAFAGNTDEAMLQLDSLRDRKEMKDYLYLDCAFAKVHLLSGNKEQAVNSYLTAYAKAVVPHEKQLLERKLRELG